jgi:Tol biopolymer transport system component
MPMGAICSSLLQLSNPGSVRSPGRPHWSPDGQNIVLGGILRGHTAIFVMPTNGGPPRALTEQTSESLNPSWSHDGRWIYFTSNRSGQWQIWKIPSAGGDSLQLTRQGGFAAFESADAKSIYYAKTASEPDIWRMLFDSGLEIPVSPPIHVNQWTGWALTINGIFFVRENTAAHPVLRFVDFAASQVHDITPLEKQPFPLWLSASADGKFALYQEFDVKISNVMMLENFR